MEMRFNYRKNKRNEKLIEIKQALFFSCEDIATLLQCSRMRAHLLLCGNSDFSNEDIKRISFYHPLAIDKAAELYGMSVYNIKATIHTRHTQDIKQGVADHLFTLYCKRIYT